MISSLEDLAYLEHNDDYANDDKEFWNSLSTYVMNMPYFLLIVF